MKKLIILATIFLIPFIAKADRFGGVWKHHYIKVEGQNARLSFKEMNLVPTYGRPLGGRAAYKIHLDIWGDLAGKTFDYKLTSKGYGSINSEHDGTLVKENHNHQYAVVTLNDEIVYLQGNQDYKHHLQITIDGYSYIFDLNL